MDAHLIANSYSINVRKLFLSVNDELKQVTINTLFLSLVRRRYEMKQWFISSSFLIRDNRINLFINFCRSHTFCIVLHFHPFTPSLPPLNNSFSLVAKQYKELLLAMFNNNTQLTINIPNISLFNHLAIYKKGSDLRLNQELY